MQIKYKTTISCTKNKLTYYANLMKKLLVQKKHNKFFLKNLVLFKIREDSKNENEKARKKIKHNSDV